MHMTTKALNIPEAVKHLAAGEDEELCDRMLSNLRCIRELDHEYGCVFMSTASFEEGKFHVGKD